MGFAPGTLLRNRYRIVRKVDESGAGEVFEAQHVELAGRYAVKVLCEGGIRNALLLDSLRNEAFATSALTHPGIVRVYDLDQTPDGSPYLVTEFLTGQPLARVIREAGPLALFEAASLVEAIASAVGEAHRHGLVHGDLGPENVFVLDARADPHARVKILDFGVERIRAHAGGVVRAAKDPATAAYRAPERKPGREWEVDERADVFSLGAIAHALITGRPPLPPAGRQTPAFAAPPAVASAVARAMNKLPEGRFESVGDFARALRAAVAASRRPSGVQRRLGATPAVPVPVLHPPTDRVRLPRRAQLTVAAAVGLGVAILLGAVITKKMSPRHPAPPPAVAVAPPPSRPAPPAAAPAPRPTPVVAVAAPAPSGAAPTAPPVVHHHHHSPHEGMTPESRHEMKQTYQEATRAFDLGNYDEAITAYKRTYELGGDAPMLYNIAQALRLSKRPDEAAVYYRRYLDRAPNAANRDEVRARIAELAGHP